MKKIFTLKNICASVALLAIAFLFGTGNSEVAALTATVLPFTTKSVGEIEAEAKARLSSFQGKVNSYEGGGNDMPYLGIGDDSLSFQGNGNSFLTESGGNAVKFAFKLTNAAAATKVIALTPAFFATAAAMATATGETVDGILTDGTIITDVTAVAADTKHKIVPLQEFVKRNPTRVIKMIIQSNTEAAFEEKITLKSVSPFRQGSGNYLTLTDYLNPNQFNTKKVEINLAKDYPDFQLDDQNVILLPIGGTNVVATTGVILNITLEIGAMVNNAGMLAKKASKAGQNISRMQASGMLKC